LSFFFVKELERKRQIERRRYITEKQKEKVGLPFSEKKKQKNVWLYIVICMHTSSNLCLALIQLHV
jgi:hypothetical protein